jgi:hypothetical protein
MAHPHPYYSNGSIESRHLSLQVGVCWRIARTTPPVQAIPHRHGEWLAEFQQP